MSEGPGSGSWWRRHESPAPFLERLRPVELPLLAETKRRIFAGDTPGALRYAYPLILEDVQRAYGLRFPPEWTHEEILRRGLPPGTGPLAEFLPRLYRLYAPARYSDGASLPPGAGMEAVELIRSLYSFAPMWRLYAWHRPSGLRRLFPPRADPARPDPPEASPAPAPTEGASEEGGP